MGTIIYARLHNDHAYHQTHQNNVVINFMWLHYEIQVMFSQSSHGTKLGSKLFSQFSFGEQAGHGWAKILVQFHYLKMLL